MRNWFSYDSNIFSLHIKLFHDLYYCSANLIYHPIRLKRIWKWFSLKHVCLETIINILLLLKEFLNHFFIFLISALQIFSNQLAEAAAWRRFKPFSDLRFRAIKIYNRVNVADTDHLYHPFSSPIQWLPIFIVP